MYTGSLIESSDVYDDISFFVDESVYTGSLYDSISNYISLLLEGWEDKVHNSVKQAVENSDKDRLKYVMVDALDVDPTFKQYMPDYLYAKKHNMFEPNKNLTSFDNDPSHWNKDYWIRLKRDYLDNPSIERLNHMRKVAKVVKADHVDEIRKNRRGIPTAEKRKENVEKYHFDQDQKKIKGVIKQQELDRERQQKIIDEVNRKNEETEKLLQQQEQPSHQEEKNVQQTLNQTMQQAQNKPKPILLRIISSLRNLYKKWLNKQNIAKNKGQDIGIFRNICRMILNCIDRLLKRIRIAVR